MRQIAAILCLGLLVIVIAACGGPAEPAEKTDYFLNASEEARTLYESKCIACHATDLRGLVGSASNLQQVGARLSKDEIIFTIENGKGQMMPFKDTLSEDEIESLADWLVTLK